MIRARLKSFMYAGEGVIIFFQTQANAWIQLASAIVVISMGIYLRITQAEWIYICLCIGLVFCAEIMNTAIEKFCDHVTTETHPSIKIIKDLSAAAVLVIAITAATVGVMVFYPYLFD